MATRPGYRLGSLDFGLACAAQADYYRILYKMLVAAVDATCPLRPYRKANASSLFLFSL